MKILPRIVIASCLVSFIGCGNKAVQEMGGGEISPDWDAAGKFGGEDGFLPIAYAAEKGQWSNAKQIAANEKFEKAIKEFADSPIPKGWEDRVDEKETMLQDMRTLHKASKEGSLEAMKDAYQKASVSFRSVRAPQEMKKK